MPAISPTPATLPPPRPAPADPVPPLNAWLKSLNERVLSAKDTSEPIIAEHFLPLSFWRDHLCLTWEYRTSHSPSAISSHLSSSHSKLVSFALDPALPPSVVPIDFAGQVWSVRAGVRVQTTQGWGVGVVTLVEDLEDSNKWKAWSVFTALMELDMFPERIGEKREEGVQHGAIRGRKNWAERRAEEREFKHESPVVLVVGAGQAGLTAAARLKVMGIPTLLVDKNPRIGDSWRNRYHQLVLHDPVYYDHMPYIPFPEFWPRFTPKDKLADWFEYYAGALELNVWTSSNVTSAKWHQEGKRWEIVIKREAAGAKEERTITPQHVVIATGHSGEPNFPQFPGQAEFKGDLLCHSSAFPGAKLDVAGKGRKAVVVGCCNSGHDIAQDYYEKGYDITIVQRSSTHVMSSENGLEILFKGLYEPRGPPTDIADRIFMSIPLSVVKRNHQGVTDAIGEADKVTLEGLTKAGFKLDKGPDGAGFYTKYIERGGGYYLDVGCSKLIAEGAVKLKQGVEIASILPNGISFADGTTLEADEIVLATGYGNMTTTAAKILGKENLEGVEDVWGVDADTGEVRGMWKQVGDKGLWFMAGNLALCRWFSRGLALGIARKVGGLE